MATIFRLGSRKILDQILKNEKIGVLSLVRPVTLKPQPVTPPKDVNYDLHNMKLGRPQSPHLSIYQPQLTWLMSITHRTSGMILAGYAVLWGFGAVILPESIPTYLDHLAQSDVNNVCLALAKFSLAAPMAFHFWNGIRHLLWDMGKFLSLKEVYMTGYVVLVLSLVSAIALTSM